MTIKLEINITNKWLYSLLIICILLVLSIGVLAYKSGQSPNILGHSGEEIEVTVNGVTKLLNNALNNITIDTLNTSILDATIENSTQELTLRSQGCKKLNNEDAKYGANHWMACPKNYYIAAITDDPSGSQDIFCCPFYP